MVVDERYKILFESVKIGPVVAPNRFIKYRTLTAWATAMYPEWSLYGR